MDCEATRIIQVSLSKITDSRRRRGGPVLRRNLLVSHVLNNVLTSTDSAYCTYRSKVEIDMDVDTVDNEAVPFDKSKMTPDIPGGSVEAGNATHTMRSAAKSNERVTEMEQSVPRIVRKGNVEVADIEKTVRGDNMCGIERKTEVKCVTGSKRARSEYGNEPCDSHAVENKRLKTESGNEPSVKELNYQEPMDISGLASVFSSSFSGLSTIPRATSSIASNLDSFQCLSQVQPVGGVFSWSQTVVEAF